MNKNLMPFLLAYLSVHYLILLSMVHYYAYFVMNTFRKWSIHAIIFGLFWATFCDHFLVSFGE